jgi:hypothetical protein
MKLTDRLLKSTNIDADSHFFNVLRAVEDIGKVCDRNQIFRQLKQSGHLIDLPILSSVLRNLRASGKLTIIRKYRTGSKWGLYTWFKDGKPLEKYL